MNRRGIEPIADSGVRPFYMFVGLGLALVAILAQVSVLQAAETTPRSPIRATLGNYKEAPRYSIVDAHGVELALSVRRHALEASPFNMWLRHTPERIFEALTAALAPELGEEAIERAFAKSFGADAAGEVRVERWPLTHTEALALSDWIANGGPAENGRTLPGFDVVRLKGLAPEREAELGLSGAVFCLVWKPRVGLSLTTRAAFADLEEKKGAASRWTHLIGNRLYRLFEGPRLREIAANRAVFDAEPDPERRVVPGYFTRRGDLQRPPETVRAVARRVRALFGVEEQVKHDDDWIFTGSRRDWVMDGLLPLRYVSLLDPVDAGRIEALRERLAEEELGVFEMWLQATSERRYPSGQLAAVGRWGWIGDRYGPQEGLEHAARCALDSLEENLVRRGEEEFARTLQEGTAERLSMQLMFPQGGKARSYYLDDTPDTAPATVETTLDLELSRYLGERLDQLVEEKTAGLAMGIVVDVETREVLALDWREPYGVVPFAPLQHFFTPGSTFKPVTMSLALELGKVRPETVIDVGETGQFLLRENEDGTGRSRWIGEAEGFLRGRRTAAECLAHSSNAGLVQIGLRVPVEEFRSRTALYGYGLPAAPDLLAEGMANLGGHVGERGDTGREWMRTRSHASVSFGDSLTTNLLQHATALVSLLDDGQLRPLRFVRAIRHGERRFTMREPAGTPLVSMQTRGELRAMLRLGATEGTGSKLERPEGMVLYSKTGTTEKLAGDVCQHLFGSRLAEDLEAIRAGETDEPADSNALHRELRGNWGGRESCYVSSIAVLAAAPGDDREVFCLLVVDDPHVEGRAFGSRVAGPAAMDILCEALDLTRGGEPHATRSTAGFGVDVFEPEAVLERAALPWASSERAPVTGPYNGGASR